MKDIVLKVQEALQEEAYKGIVRVDSQTMRQLDIRAGDIIEIEGSRKTVGIADRAYPSDIGQAIIRMDGIIRRNAKTGIGEFVKIRKAEVREAKSLVIAPAQKGVMIQANPEIFKQGLLGRALVKGDIMSLGGARRRRRTLTGSPFEDIFNFGEEIMNFGFGTLKFIVADTNPKTPAVIVTENTEVRVSSKAIEVTDEKIPEVTYEDIGGLDEELKKIREMVELPLRNPEIFERLGIEPPKGVLLYGPPGTGKTLLAKAVANETNANFIMVNGPEMTSKFYGESEKRIRDLFEEAQKNAPSIIFIDELDSIAPAREEVYGEVERRMVAQLLAVMDGIKSRGKVIVIGATNRPNALDPALRRPGRFDREIVIGVPNKKGRLKILQIHTRNMPLEGAFHAEIMSQELINQLNEMLGEAGADEEKVREELQELKKKPDATLIEKLKDKLTGVQRRIDRLEYYQLLFKKREELDKACQMIYDLSGSERVYKEVEGDTSGAIHFLDKKKVQLDKQVESAVRELLELKVINNEFKEKVGRKFIERDLERYAEITHGFVGADLEALCKEAAMNVLRRELQNLKLEKDEPLPPETLAKLRVTNADFRAALKIVRPSALREVLIEAPNVHWEDIGGLEELKMQLKEAVELPLKKPEAFQRLGIKPPKGILLYGPSGTGKTMLAKAVATESEANFILVKGPELLNKFVGESEKGVRKVFEKARQTAPTIIFFDEIDALVPRRGLDLSSQVTERVVNAVLAEMDGLEELSEVVILGATNRPDLLDPALLRPGRFDRAILTPLPDKEARLSIFKIYTKNMPLAKDVNIEEIAENTDRYTGADIAGLCKEAGLTALRRDLETKEILKKDFDEAMKRVRRSLRDEDIKRYQDIEDSYLQIARANQVDHKKQMYFG